MTTAITLDNGMRIESENSPAVDAFGVIHMKNVTITVGGHTYVDSDVEINFHDKVVAVESCGNRTVWYTDTQWGQSTRIK